MTERNVPEAYAAEPGGTILAGHFDEDDGYRMFRPNGMDDWLIVMTLSGEGYFRTASGETRCSPGQVGLLRSGVPHEYGTVPGRRWNFVWAHFQRLPEIGYLPQEEALVRDLPGERQRKRVYRAFRAVLQDSRERSAYWRELCENAIREILLIVAQRTEKRTDPRIEEALQWLSRNMTAEFRLAALARAVGLSESRLSHLFKQETGQSALDHLNGMRLRQAALLMRRMGRSATEASLDVGYNNYNHFAALFRRTYGTSPRSYAKRLDEPDHGTPRVPR